VDWSDPDQLRNLLRQRVFAALKLRHHEDAWNAINTPFDTGDAVGTSLDALGEDSSRAAAALDMAAFKRARVGAFRWTVDEGLGDAVHLGDRH